MYRLLRFIFLGRWELPKEVEPCSHVWETISERGYSYHPKGAIHVRYTLRCTKCGDIKGVDTND